MATYPTILVNYVLDQIFGFQDANYFVSRTDSLRDAMIKEHGWDATDSSVDAHGKHSNLPYSALKATSVQVLSTDTTLQTVGDFSFSEDTLIPQTGRCFEAYPTTFYAKGNYSSSAGVLTNLYAALDVLHYSAVMPIAANHPSYPVEDTIDILTYCRASASGTNGSSETSVTLTITGEVNFLTASPPHMVFDMEKWGYFCDVMRDKDTKEIKRGYLGQDPHWFNVNKTKDDPELPEKYPHPFMEYAPYTDRLPEEDNLEIVMFDMRDNPLKINEENVREMAKDLFSGKYPEITENINEMDISRFPDRFKNNVKIITKKEV